MSRTKPLAMGRVSSLRASPLMIAILSFITALLSESPKLVEANGNNNVQQKGPTSLSHPDQAGRPQLMVAIYCGSQTGNSRTTLTLYHNQYLEIDSRKWKSDRSASAICTRDKQAILDYCKKVYPDKDIRNIVESSRPHKIDNWCRIGRPERKCHTKLTTRPYRCLEGTFQSDALLVPERCVFDHVHNKSVCESSDSWSRSATEACHSKGMKLQSFGMLQPCGLDVFSGVEFVCCPNGDTESKLKSDSSQPDQNGNSFAQAAVNILPSWSKETKYEIDEQSNNINSDEVASKAQHDHGDNQGSGQNTPDSGEENEDEDDEYDDEEDGYDDDSSSWNGDKSSASSSTTTTTTTTERPIEHYLSHFDLAHEHDDYKRAELSVEGSYRDKIAHVMREWSQLNTRFEEMKKKDIQAAEDFKRKMTHEFKKTIEALEQESAAQRHQLASMHAERAMAIINRRKKVAMDCLTQALDRIPIRTRQVERCIFRLLKALEKDRDHTLRQYKSLLNLNTREALRERKIILDHLITLNRAANQSIAMLDRSPILVEKLKGKIVALWHKLRGVPLDEPIVKESEEKVMDQYEEEAAQRKIERERKRLIEQESNPMRQEPAAKLSDEVNKAMKAKDVASSQPKANVQGQDNAGTTTPPPTARSAVQASSTKSEDASIELQQQQQQQKQQQQQQQQSSQVSAEAPSNVPSASRLVGREIIDKDRSHYQVDSVGFSHLRLEAPYHELSYSVKHEPLEGRLRFGPSTILISSLAAVVLIAFLGVKFYGKASSRAYRRQGFAEVGRSCPEEKNVTHMQFNGYENPAYKFFEAEA